MAHEELRNDATPQSPDDARIAARRRFLKGTTLALPAVMTLHSVAAQATARSSGAQCANNVPQYPCVHLRQDQDDYARAKVGCYDKLYENSEGKWVGDGKQTYFRGVNSVNQLECWRKVADGSVVTSSEELKLINHETNTKRTGGTPGPCGDPRYAIIHFSAIDGRVMAVGEPQTPVGCIMTSITMACLHSLTGAG